jgi:AcrR family transcriptional regulator
VTRPLDEANRAELMDRVLEDVLAHGIGSLSLRPLAKRIGVSAAALLYNFTSKEELTIAILKRAGDRQRALFETIRSREDATPAEACGEIWRRLSAAKDLPLFRLFFEVYGLALQDRERFPDFFSGAIERWIDFIGLAFERSGTKKRAARVQATFVLACFRGFLLDLCATEDYARVNGAVKLWLQSISDLPASPAT